MIVTYCIVSLVAFSNLCRIVLFESNAQRKNQRIQVQHTNHTNHTRGMCKMKQKCENQASLKTRHNLNIMIIWAELEERIKVAIALFNTHLPLEQTPQLDPPIDLRHDQRQSIHHDLVLV